jgi:hypothetical protein
VETIALEENLSIELNNGRKMYFSYMSDFDNPIFLLDGDKNKLTIVANSVHSVSGGDYDEPSCPVKEEFQAKILVTHNYNFFTECFEEK